MTAAKKSAITWIELALLILTVSAGMGIWIVAKQWVDIWQKANEPLEVNYQKEANVLTNQARLSSTQGELTALQSRLALERIELVEKQDLLDSLTEAQKPQSSPAPSPANTDIEKAKVDLEATKRLISKLSTELNNKVTDAVRAQTELETAKRSAATDLAKAQLKFLWHKRLVTLEYAGIAIGLLLVLVLAVVSIIRGARRFKASRMIVVGGAACVLAILIGYEILELAGAALIGVLVVIIVLTVMPSGENHQET